MNEELIEAAVEMAADMPPEIQDNVNGFIQKAIAGAAEYKNILHIVYCLGFVQGCDTALTVQERELGHD